MDRSAALAGLRVIDFSNQRTGAQVSQILADFGADVLHVEPIGGSPLRAEAAWPCWARGKRAIQLDLKNQGDLATARALAAHCDVAIETFRPGTAERLGLGYDALAADNPRLVYASITGFGPNGPMANMPGYEAVVLAKFGAMSALSGLTDREGPAFPTAAYASYPASQLALQAILAALYERETSGAGQRVQTSLAQALTVHDTFNWFSRVVARRYSDGFVQTPRSTKGVPGGGLSFRLLIALTADGQWLQFSQTPDRLFRAMMEMFGLTWMFDHPQWSTAPDFDDVNQRIAFWEILLKVVRSRTAAQWAEAFDRHPNVWGECFRKDSELLDHPQMQWNGMVARMVDSERGVVRQPGALARMSLTPAQLDRPAPRLGEHDAALRALAAQAPPPPRPAAADAPPGLAPLTGVTVVELGTYYAAPFGATLLAELGARVIKLEQLDGDPHRNMLPFPEIAGLKVLQGKQCVAVELHTDKGRQIAHRVISGADIVLQSFRAGVAQRLGLDAQTLRVLNPDLIYVSAPGYGEDGPCGHRPAFAPTIGAAAGLAWRNAGATIPTGSDLTLDEIKPAAMRLGAAVMGVGNSDGLSAVTVASAMLIGLYARQRGAGGQDLMTTMLSSTAHALSEIMVEYPDRPPVATADGRSYGLGALYRLYETADGWVFLAAPSDQDWSRLAAALPDGKRLADDPRYATRQSRVAHDTELSADLAAVLRSRPAEDWQEALLRAAVACAVVAPAPVESNYLDDDSLGRASGYVTMGRHPILDEIPRLAPLVGFSRSSTVAGDAGLVGQDTAAVLGDFGFDADDIIALEREGVIVLA